MGGVTTSCHVRGQGKQGGRAQYYTDRQPQACSGVRASGDGLILATKHIDLHLPNFHHDFINCVAMVGCHAPDCSSCTCFES
jgi:hypothetical protein